MTPIMDYGIYFVKDCDYDSLFSNDMNLYPDFD